MYFDRLIDTELQAWASETPRKPLVLRGARQTGKTSAVREFARHFDAFLELNLERHADRDLARACTSTTDLLAALQVRHNVASLPPRTLVFLDELQEHPPAVGWLRFFYEDHPEIAVIAAGSLLEVRLQDRGFSFPVGRVTFRRVHPFTFMEFLRAIGRSVLADRLQAAIRRLERPPAAIHAEALAAFRDWLLVGGMPEAVATWVAGKSPAAVRRVHSDLIT